MFDLAAQFTERCRHTEGFELLWEVRKLEHVQFSVLVHNNIITIRVLYGYNLQLIVRYIHS